jgi:hypothetical protein
LGGAQVSGFRASDESNARHFGRLQMPQWGGCGR